MLEVEDIQSAVLRPRPAPYSATYLFLKIENQNAGRELMRRAARVVSSSAHPEKPGADFWVGVALTFEGLKALGVPQASLDSFPEEFKQGMAARASILGDHGEHGPEHWEKPFATKDLHILVTGLAPKREQLDLILQRAREMFQGMGGVKLLAEQDCFAPSNECEAFGYRDGISHPAIEGSGIPGSNPLERPIKAGEFVLGYEDEMGAVTQYPQPDVLGRNGTYAVLRKLHQDVAAFRRFLKENSESAADEDLLAAKMMGRWRSGAPLALSPERDSPELGRDRFKNNVFLFYDDDKLGFKTPPGSHIRRMNPRDGLKDSGTFVNLRRMLRRGTSYGPELPPDALEDDGAERGLMFLFIGAHLRRQFEFVQSTWLNDGEFIACGTQPDPIVGAKNGPGEFVIPKRPIKRRVPGLDRFVTVRGGEYFFVPGIKALQWLSELNGGGKS